MDEYASHLKNYTKLNSNSDPSIYDNPVWHIHGGKPPKKFPEIQYSLLLNLVSASNSESKEILWGFLNSYYDSATLNENRDAIDNMIGFAINYFNQFVKPKKQYRKASQNEEAALRELSETLNNFMDVTDPEIIQSEIYRIGREYQFEPMRDWFCSIYEVLLGQKDGPRFGSFVLIYGVENTQKLIMEALAGNYVRNK